MPLYPPASSGGGPHAVDHESGGSDEIDVTGLLGLLGTAQTPAAHTHTGVYEPANANIQSHVVAAHAPSDAQKNSDITKAEIEAKLTGAITSHSHAGGGSDAVHIATPSDIAINSVTDITIATHDVLNVVAGDQVILDAWFIILNNSTATRVCVITVDFDAAFDIEISTAALAFSSTLMHVFRVEAVCNVRSTSLSYMMVEVVGQLAAGIASGTDTTMAATHLHGKGWGTSAGDLTGTLTTVLKIRSAAATATQTCRLLHCSIRKVSPL